MGGRWQTAVAVLLSLGVIAGLVAASGPRIQAGDPLPRDRGVGVVAKPDPPKLRTDVLLLKPVAVDLGPVPAPVSVAPPEDPLVQELTVRLQQAIRDAGNAGRSAVNVIDADGRVVFDSGGTTPLIPASTAKLVSAAMVLVTLGPDRTLATTVDTAGPVGPDGTVVGDLVLRGGGDPTLVSDTYVTTRTNPDRPMTPIAQLADQVVAAGVTRVQGRVVGDPGFLVGPALAEGWPPRYLEDLDATPITGLTIDQGFTYVQEGGSLRARAATDPAAEAAAALTTALRARGVTVDGQPTADGADIPVGPVTLGRLESPPVSVLLQHMVQESDNHIADTLFRAAGRHAAGDGAFADAADLLDEVLAALQLDWSTTVMADGSGLSRADLIPPALLTTLNYRMTNSTVGPAWQDLMAVSGVSGTLERRLTDSIAELRLRGKTGSLGDVRAISGAVVGPDGRPLYVTVTSNGLERAQLDNARRLQDLVVLALAAQLYGCVELPPEVTAAPATPPPPDALPPLPRHSC